jgi:hypothetical protein
MLRSAHNPIKSITHVAFETPASPILSQGKTGRVAQAQSRDLPRRGQHTGASRRAYNASS